MRRGRAWHVLLIEGALWAFRVAILVTVVWGTIATLRAGRYSGSQWLDFVEFGLAQGGIYALIALGYTMVYGVLNMINFAHGDVFMAGAYTAYYVAAHRRCRGARRVPAAATRAAARAAHHRHRRVVFSRVLVPQPVRRRRAIVSGYRGARREHVAARHRRPPHAGAGPGVGAGDDAAALLDRDAHADRQGHARRRRGPRRRGADGDRRRRRHRVHVRARRGHGGRGGDPVRAHVQAGAFFHGLRPGDQGLHRRRARRDRQCPRRHARGAVPRCRGVGRSGALSRRPRRPRAVPAP